ncbi:MAG TPA: hypothetical protein VFH34_10615 [Anaerolineales bacterium]|nr:hypothetical protein [Anaerolineales bacterium]
MHRNPRHVIISFVVILVSSSLACAISQPTPIPTNTPKPSATATETAVPTNTIRPSATPRPTRTPNLAATERAEELNAEAQEYFEKGYLATPDGSFRELEDFSFDWAQLGFYRPFLIQDSVGDFFLSAHFKWDSAFRNSDTSGCGFIFGVQPNDDHYAVFLDRQRVLFLITDNTVGFSRPVTPTRGTGIVKFDYPAEADFTLIVKGAYAYVLVNGEVVGEYTLALSRSSKGGVGVTVLSGTNRDFGTRCEMTNLHLWLPNE